MGFYFLKEAPQKCQNFLISLCVMPDNVLTILVQVLTKSACMCFFLRTKIILYRTILIHDDHTMDIFLENNMDLL